MLFTIRHHTRYSYSKPVRLGPQDLRFQPRDGGAQRVIEHRLDIAPEPHGVNEHIDLGGKLIGASFALRGDAELNVERPLFQHGSAAGLKRPASADGRALPQPVGVRIAATTVTRLLASRGQKTANSGHSRYPA